ncbi:DNA methyltransferase [Nocardioides sp. Root140]|uniref:DNA methyltransferase n=1 Tax=Nocardioides sp. Root140 TaxID=1736460 RepID=UPI0006F5AB83|nr:DNA methyltransferase [Nocardioides sp. Root140]KQY61454.1 DNA methyltransferase [Nocardioides sp. Root140]
MEPEDLRPNLRAFVDWRSTYLRGDEKGEAQTFLDRLFKAFGHEGAIEAGAVYEDRVKFTDYMGTRFADLMWKPRVLIEMKKAKSDLSRHFRQAFDYWQMAVPDRPRYVILCNFDEFWVYDFDQQLDAPMDVVRIEDLPQRYEALAFMLPDAPEPIFDNDLVEVTREAAAQVSSVFRSMVARGVDRLDAQHFVLQSVVAMFSEDIGLLPSHFFTRTVTTDSKNGKDAYDLLGSLFREMNTPGRTSGGRFEGTPYFNGGLFAAIKPIEMTPEELQSMREACRTDWAAVRPEIFGTLFETSMDAGERHAYGAHFTTQADIMKIVGPCIVQPWMDRIDTAKKINDYEQILLDMSSYRVLDPACGSGNFLYVAYREMRRLEAETKRRLVERTRGGERAQDAFAYVNADNFLGLDNNPYAIEVAKVTLMMAKKLASDELSGGQEDTLPLENLDNTIRYGDALFNPWPKTNVVIGNPPYLGRRKMADELGAGYVGQLDERYPSPGVSDFVTYWFPLAHAALPDGGRAGFVATQAIRDNASRVRSLDYIVNHDGEIFDAVSSQPWSGDAAVTVSIVNWVKGSAHSPAEKTLWLDNGELRLPVDSIPPTLRPTTDVRKAVDLIGNKSPKVCFQGQTTGNVAGFRLTPEEAIAMTAADPGSGKYVHPMLSADPMLKTQGIGQYVIDLPHDDAVRVSRTAPAAINHLRRTVLPSRERAAFEERENNEDALRTNPKYRTKKHHQNFLNVWWKHAYRRDDMLSSFERLRHGRYIALSIVAAESRLSVYNFVSSEVRPDASLQVFSLDDDYSFGVLSSTVHRLWFNERCSKLETRPRYTPTTVWNSFPWPLNPGSDVVRQIATASERILNLRQEYQDDGVTLGAMYDALRQPGNSALRGLHEQLDAAVVAAYGFNEDEDVLAQLLALNVAYGDDPGSAQRPGGGRFGEAAYASEYRLAAEPLIPRG